MCLIFSDQKLKRDGKPKKAQPDHLQHIPFRLREIMKSKERIKTGPLKAKKLKGGEKSFFISLLCKLKAFFLGFVYDQSGLCLSLAFATEDSYDGNIPVLHFKRGKKESEKAYVRRMENDTKHILFLTKNQVDRKPELDADKQERPTDKGKSEKKKE